MIGHIGAGFFSDAHADAKARGTDKPKLNEQQLKDEYASFMQQVETDAVATAQATATEKEEEEGDKAVRDEIEHL